MPQPSEIDIDLFPVNGYLYQPVTSAQLYAELRRLLTIEAQRMETDKEKKSGEHGSRHKVLVVDDDKEMRNAYKQILQMEGCDVMTAADGPAGLDMVRRYGPDLVLLVLTDLKMSGMDGIAYMKSVKALDSDIVPIIITDHATLGVTVEAMKAGAYDFLPKPFKPMELCDVVRRGIEDRSALRVSALPHGKAPSAELHLAMLAHRFKSPLATMRQCLWVILQGYTGEASPRMKGMIEIIAQRVDQLIQLVDDWFTLSCLEQGKGIKEAQAVNVADLVKAVVDRARQDPRANKIELRFAADRTPATIRADPKALDELFANLVDNAVRYIHEGGTVTVEAGLTADGAVVTVGDTGPGITAEDMPRLFEPFFRGRLQRSIPGTGLGLPIAKRIAEEHGGRIEVESTPGKGSMFRVFLPRAGMKTKEP